ncbi:MAG: arylsulfatase [Bacteroidales bacterium]|nr:arylsulfatase [Bacteroidales bacterium]
MRHLIVCVLVFLLSVSQQSCSVDAPDAHQPNIVYILADDLGYGDVSCLNPESKIPTPAIDKLAGEGISFSEAHTNSSVCTPTRYGTLTGRYCWRSRLKSQVLEGHEPELIEKGRETVASILQKSGYNTACIGKWHLGLNFARIDSTLPLTEGKRWAIRSSANVDYTKPLTGGPRDHGFDYGYYIAGSLDMMPHCFIENGHIQGTIERRKYQMTHFKNRGLNYRDGDIAEGFNHVDALGIFTNKACNYILEQSEQEEPFFLYLPLTAPHTPWVPTDPFKDRSEAGVYGDFVVMVDHMIQKVLQSIDDAGIRENTIVVVTSDNGSDQLESESQQFNHQANFGRRGRKTQIYDGGHRVPYIVRWPSVIKPGSRSDELISSTDLMATLADIVKFPLTSDMAEDSYSFYPVLKGDTLKKPLRDYTIFHSFWGKYAIRKGKWKLIDTNGSFEMTSMEGELYDMENDSLETTNLIGQYPDVANELRALLEKAKRN